jgi:hypothetical protein
LYQEGADYVLRPNFLTAAHLLEVLERLLREDHAEIKHQALAKLSQHREILP